MGKIFKTMEEFEKEHYPGDLKKYPFTIRVTQEEMELIMRRRNWVVTTTQSKENTITVI